MARHGTQITSRGAPSFQLRDYENAVLQKRLDELADDEIDALMKVRGSLWKTALPLILRHTNPPTTKEIESEDGAGNP